MSLITINNNYHYQSRLIAFVNIFRLRHKRKLRSYVNSSFHRPPKTSYQPPSSRFLSDKLSTLNLIILTSSLVYTFFVLLKDCVEFHFRVFLRKKTFVVLLLKIFHCVHSDRCAFGPFFQKKLGTSDACADYLAVQSEQSRLCSLINPCMCDNSWKRTQTGHSFIIF